MWNDKPIAVWKGWEYENKYGTHIIVSKRHIFVDGKPVCGCRVDNPECVSRNCGDEPCQRCLNWEYKHDEEYEVI